jgi:WXG100 family type VII secretion target
VADTVQARYDELEQLAARFGKASAASAELHTRITRCVEALERGGWQGQGADAFFAEMRGTLYPAMQRLIKALDEGRATTLQAKQILRAAEEEAAKLFGSGTNANPAGQATPNAAAPSKEAQAEVQKLIDAGDRDGAIQEAIRRYNIDVRAVKGPIKFDQAVNGEGITSVGGTVKIGADAFTSPGWLASSVGHEALHARQLQEGRWDLKDTPQGIAINEVESYDWEINHATQNGLNQQEIDTLKRRRQQHYSKLSDPNKKRVDQGNYTLP